MSTLPVVNNFDGGSNGTSITTVNSGTSGSAFDTVVVNGTSATYSNTFTNHSTALAAKYLATSSSYGSTTNYTFTAASSGTTIYARAYVLTPNNPASTDHLNILNIRGAGNRQNSVSLGNTGKFSINMYPTGGFITGVTTYSTNIWYRVELSVFVHATLGQVTANVYLGDNSTPLETIQSAASYDTSSMSEIDIGAGIYFTTGTYTLYLDDVGANNTGWLGPTASAISDSDTISVSDVVTNRSFTDADLVHVLDTTYKGSFPIYTRKVVAGVNESVTTTTPITSSETVSFADAESVSITSAAVTKSDSDTVSFASTESVSYSITIPTDSASIADIQTLVPAVSSADSGSVLDLQALTTAQSSSDTASVLDQESVTFQLSVSSSDNVSVLDSQTIATTQSSTDTVSVLDQESLSIQLSVSSSDIVSAVDSQSLSIASVLTDKSDSDSVFFSDESVGGFPVYLTYIPAEVIEGNYSQADSISFTDAAYLSFGEDVTESDAITAVESQSIAVSTYSSDIISATDAESLSITSALHDKTDSDSISAVDDQVVMITPAFESSDKSSFDIFQATEDSTYSSVLTSPTDNISALDNAQVLASQQAQDSVKASDSQSQVAAVTDADGARATESSVVVGQYTGSDTATLVDSQAVLTQVSSSDSIHFTDTEQLNTTESFNSSDNIHVSDSATVTVVLSSNDDVSVIDSQTHRKAHKVYSSATTVHINTTAQTRARSATASNRQPVGRAT